ncbi:helix-turn-helix domain-containing protein [Cytobacillus oceanisediminis]|uniref:helix-turn-helix domain-containing protein n=1 Tax=Cytobacillus oceanisediminis TaxID=665099 RepID=UPI001C230587|nr:helix-turn-helix transcriptional regulator [Cytobacillus oceanisediminis]MBU8770285.1 helix-turn-helix domain-containing protein [Cytobacillus oceanisediminis]
MNIGEKINKLRTEKKLSMRELGEKIGVSHAHISKLESGISSPSMELLKKLSDFFDIDVSYFVSDESVFTTEEKNVLKEKELSIEHLKEHYNLVIDGKPATEEEIQRMIEHVKLYRLMKQQERS